MYTFAVKVPRGAGAAAVCPATFIRIRRRRENYSALTPARAKTIAEWRRSYSAGVIARAIRLNWLKSRNELELAAVARWLAFRKVGYVSNCERRLASSVAQKRSVFSGKSLGEKQSGYRAAAAE